MAASIALLGFRKALSDRTIAALVDAYARSYVEQVRRFPLQSAFAEDAHVFLARVRRRNRLAYGPLRVLAVVRRLVLRKS